MVLEQAHKRNPLDILRRDLICSGLPVKLKPSISTLLADSPGYLHWLACIQWVEQKTTGAKALESFPGLQEALRNPSGDMDMAMSGDVWMVLLPIGAPFCEHP